MVERTPVPAKIVQRLLDPDFFNLESCLPDMFHFLDKTRLLDHECCVENTTATTAWW